MNKLLAIVILLNLLILSAKAQYQQNATLVSEKIPNPSIQTDSILKNDSLINKSLFSNLTIHADARIDTLIVIQKEENLRKGGFDGYRLQIFQGSKPEALREKAKFIEKYHQYKVYTPFISPDVFVRIGDFRTESEAVKLKYIIKKDFPHAIVIPSIIEYPKLKN